VLDSGSKTLSSDPMRPSADGFGIVAGRESRIARISEEHGVLAVAPGESFRVGERVRIRPNHACAVVNLHDALVAVRGGRVEGSIAVDARGRVQ
jgi:D-serine deaminase-like pyridoxal phosphate-dependent protein